MLALSNLITALRFQRICGNFEGHPVFRYNSIAGKLKMNYRIREIKPTEYSLPEDFLYEAVFVPEGAAQPERSIIRAPELQVYVENFGKIIR